MREFARFSPPSTELISKMTEKEMRSKARLCAFLAEVPDRKFSFCLTRWIDDNGDLMFRKITYKDCMKCMECSDS